MIFTISMILGVPLALIFVFSVEPELESGQGIALAVILAAIASYVLAVIVSSGNSEDDVDPEEAHVAEAERALEILGRELMNIYNSISRQYEKITDFLYLYPEYAARLKETEQYKDWRDRLLFWADENIERLKDFYFSDGYTFYINKDLELVNLFEKNAMEPAPYATVVCEVSIKRDRLPEDYFEHAFTVWEEEDFEDYPTGGNGSDYKDASTSGLALGLGLGVGLSLSGHDTHHGGHGCDCGDCDCSCQ